MLETKLHDADEKLAASYNRLLASQRQLALHQHELTGLTCLLLTQNVYMEDLCRKYNEPTVQVQPCRFQLVPNTGSMQHGSGAPGIVEEAVAFTAPSADSASHLIALTGFAEQAQVQPAAESCIQLLPVKPVFFSA